MATLTISNFDTKLVFRSRPESIPGDLRPLWRICMVVLILKLASYGNKSSIKRLFLVNWAIQTKENQEKLKFLVKGKNTPETIIIRYDPPLMRALDLARGEGLLEFISGNRVRLTPQGLLAASELLNNNDLFVNEKNFLREVGKNNFSEKKVMSILVEGK